MVAFCGFKCVRPTHCDGHSTFIIKNNSTRTINPEIYWEYPNFKNNPYNPKFDGTDGIKPGDSLIRGAGRSACWEQILDSNRYGYLFIFDQDSLNTLSFDTILIMEKGLLFEKKLDLLYLIENNFTIVYSE